jgi:CRP-like cAMP-binding protein
MKYQDVIDNFSQHLTFQPKELQGFFDLVIPRKVKKNEIIIQKGDPSEYFIFIRQGCLMTYFTDEKNFVHVIQFGIDKWWTGDLDGFMEDKPSIYSIKAMCDSEIWLLNKQRFLTLCNEHVIFDRFFRILFQKSLISHQKRIIRNISFNGEEKYLTFIKNFPKLELLIPQKYIASYLGITLSF